MTAVHSNLAFLVHNYFLVFSKSLRTTGPARPPATFFGSDFAGAFLNEMKMETFCQASVN